MDIGVYVFYICLYVYICLYRCEFFTLQCTSTYLNIFYIFIRLLQETYQIAFCILKSPIIALYYISVFLYIKRTSCSNVMKIQIYNSNFNSVEISEKTSHSKTSMPLPPCNTTSNHLLAEEEFPLFIKAQMKTSIMDSFTFTILMLLAIIALETRKVLIINQRQIQEGQCWQHAPLISSEKCFLQIILLFF